MSSRISVSLLLLAVVATMFFTANVVDATPRSQGNMMRYGNSLPAYAPHVLYRFYNSRQFAPINKRNNAEVVNHILKNFGALDRLGDVGK
ncbi:Pigment dispersing factor homolog pdf-2 [Caenorhabditis elegans]|uniref:Pigment dispersing factor homolog pdf-2 n=1 Tax=Caenorhabditis elegans TaxID=6239 RepID=PDF2_CAEEL|nr:Pigment dispersing factor homolog pdf-2 [Caenorhabditis elegans]G5EGC3.1 RecName: Full=Pigment dispersing factor homolog pdf-2; Flags: Precursor [Caenorhabditis elegans]ABO42260.1 pigment dispersing factor 2 [Caenorhabditis elegans]CCD68823.1 Pigment dispersing factor homolog pdf-2 [Caenorhabditis elegans]|eukprot:NP_508397.2 Neuropeptide-Like Protein [Caenorhabditis elegans]